MRFAGTLFLFAGYALVYASIANRGKFAANPWMGLFFDAYTSDATNTSGIIGPSWQQTQRRQAPQATTITPANPNAYGSPSRRARYGAK